MVATHARLINETLSNDAYISDAAKAMRVYDRCAVIACDLETTGAPGTKDGLSHKKGQVAVVAFHAPGRLPVVLHYPYMSGGPSSELMHWLEDRILIGHNLTAFDIPFLMKYGFRPFKSKGWIDTLIAEQLAITSGRRDLKKDLGTTLNRRLGIPIDKGIDHEGWGHAKLNTDQLHYVLNDITLLVQLWDKQHSELVKNETLDAWELEQAIFPITANMIGTGIAIDLEVLDDFIAIAVDELDTNNDFLERTLGTSMVNSPKKMLASFEEAFGVKLPNTTKDTMLQLAGRTGNLGLAAKNVNEARMHKKRGMYNSTWLDKYMIASRICAQYFPLGTDTARFASRNPNMQQIPRNMRGIFGYPEDSNRLLLSVDYGQIEVIIFAILTGEKRMIDLYRGGADMHTSVAALIYGKTEADIIADKAAGGNLRKTAKAATFAMLFAGGRASIIRTARKEGVELSEQDAMLAMRGFFKTFPQANAYINGQRNDADRALRNNYSITLRIPGGPKRTLYGADVTASRLINTLVQGTASVGLKAGMRELLRAGIAPKLVACVHDELVFDTNKAEVAELDVAVQDCMRRGMKSIIGITPKVESSYGSHWQ